MAILPPSLEATSKWWVVSESRRGGGPASPEYALAVSRGRVVAAYRIDSWQRAPSGPRWGFVGELAADLTALYRGVDVTTYFPPGAANPLRYVNCVAPTLRSGRPANPRPKLLTLKRTELDETVKRLKAEPLTHLMLGHRELFHSNLLAWFFECMPESADAVFGSLTRASPRSSTLRTVRREKKNLDLWFAWPGRCPLVIENKVFSLPDEAQLASYGERAGAGEEHPTLCLLSLSDPSWPDDRKDNRGPRVAMAELSRPGRKDPLGPAARVCLVRMPNDAALLAGRRSAIRPGRQSRRHRPEGNDSAAVGRRNGVG